MVQYAHKFPELVWLQRAQGRRIGLFGGSFNPVHEGHWQCAEGLRKAYGLHQVWWLPTLKNPLKSGEMQKNFTDRAYGIKTRVIGHPNHRLSLLLAEPKFYYTFDFLAFIGKFRHNNTLFWLAGSDILSELHHWRNWQKIPNYCTMLFYSRGGCGLAASPARQYLRKSPVVMGKRLRVSSTEIRAIQDTQNYS